VILMKQGWINPSPNSDYLLSTFIECEQKAIIFLPNYKKMDKWLEYHRFTRLPDTTKGIFTNSSYYLNRWKDWDVQKFNSSTNPLTVDNAPDYLFTHTDYIKPLLWHAYIYSEWAVFEKYDTVVFDGIERADKYGKEGVRYLLDAVVWAEWWKRYAVSEVTGVELDKSGDQQRLARSRLKKALFEKLVIGVTMDSWIWDQRDHLAVIGERIAEERGLSV